MSHSDSRKPHFWDCGWHGPCVRALWIIRGSGDGKLMVSVALCGKTGPNRVRAPRISGLVQKIGRPQSGAGTCICGFVRKDEAAIGHQAEYLWPCAERRGIRTDPSRASVALCGKTTSKDRRGQPRGEQGTDSGHRPYGAGRGAAGTGDRTDMARGGTGPSQKSERTGVSVVAATSGSYDVQARQRLAYSPRAATSSSWLPNSAIRPSMTTAIRSASCAVCRRWAMATTVRPSSRAAIDPSR
jgi:hypothetical protein